MPVTKAHEAPRASLLFSDETMFNMSLLCDLAAEALQSYGLRLDADPEIGVDHVTLSASGVGLRIWLCDGSAQDQTSLCVAVIPCPDTCAVQGRDEALLAEIMSILIEGTGATAILWMDTGVVIPARRFQSAFTPMRFRAPDQIDGSAECIVPRRPGRKAGAAPAPLTPKSLISTMPDTVTPLAPPPSLDSVFRDADAPESASVFSMKTLTEPRLPLHIVTLGAVTHTLTGVLSLSF
ncbi:hypothetical protein ACRARG_19925 [Pseudooceanicola sp. C21-150M6]|uniref:hypothetical protein n=1 Tax=Pseudooceanicola sp. C21-150M6 TaxID=3434355 RepID=UPI003D7F7786